MISASALFIWLGLDVAIFHHIIDDSWTVNEQPTGVWIVAGIFFFLVPAIIIKKLIPYMIKSPVMLRVDEDGVTFGIGMGYVPFTIPLKYLKEVRAVRMEGTISMPFALGLALYFEKSNDIPSSKMTSAGIVYGFHRLFLRWSYMNQFPGKVAKRIEAWIQHEKEASYKRPKKLVHPLASE